MSAWKKLGPGWAEVLDGSGAEDDMGVDLLIALGMEARLREAARALALEEHLLGAHVDVSEPVVQTVRLAADDGSGAPATRMFADGKLRVAAHIDGGDLVLTQRGGAPGITVVLGERWVPLQASVPARATGISELPESLVVLDRKGRRRTLKLVE